ncbi:MAG: hypothetical protein HY878_04510 [Deltaproteobacteria bacterium]|nr:hypothetical protein [Deltaproteobacteria bacterium]
MKEERLLSILEEAVERLSIKLRYEDLKKGEVDTQGGDFVLKGKRYIFVHKSLPVSEKVRVLMEVLAGLPLDDIHLPPEVRERLERIRGKTTHLAEGVEEEVSQ